MKEINIEENIENRVIDLITEGSEDRLIVFKPKEDTEVIDLVVKKRGEYKKREISFQINIFIGPGGMDRITKDISRENFAPDKSFYLMFVYFDIVKQDVNNIWIIPSAAFLEVSESRKSEDNKPILRFETTTVPEKQDKYAKFLIDKKELGNFLLEII